MARKIVFNSLYERTYHVAKRNKYIYKHNIYTFFFLNDLNKYISIQGLVINNVNKTHKTTYYSLGKRIKFYTKINNEFATFQLPINMPGLHI